MWDSMGVTFIYIKVLALLRLKTMYGFVKLEDPMTDSQHQNIPSLANRPLLRARPPDVITFSVGSLIDMRHTPKKIIWVKQGRQS